MKKYKTSGTWRARIEVVKIERETEQSVWIKGRRNAKRTEYDCYFDTWDEAKAYLLKQAEAQLASARSRLEHARENYDHIKDIKPDSLDKEI